MAKRQQKQKRMPRKGGAGPRVEIRIRIPHELAERTKAQAMAEGRSIANLCRLALTRYLDTVKPTGR